MVSRRSSIGLWIGSYALFPLVPLSCLPLQCWFWTLTFASDHNLKVLPVYTIGRNVTPEWPLPPQPSCPLKTHSPQAAVS